MNRAVTTLFMLMSLDGKISTGCSNSFDFDTDLPLIDGVSQGKTVIALGFIPNANSIKVTQSASLQEMLDQPLLKKALWHMMRAKQQNME